MKYRQDVHKQETQLRYCLIQANEYFAAANSVTLVTKPVLLYYSIMSLVLAEILFKQDGMSSLDEAREQNKHHGLIFQFNRANREYKPLSEAASELVAVPHEIKGKRIGTFELWHRSCRETPICGLITTQLPTGTQTNFNVIPRLIEESG
jgi:hypothetical protein